MEIDKIGKKIRRNLFQFWNELDPKIKEKFSNLCGKTGQGSVPSCLFQKRTSRTNRVLLPLKTMFNNNITFKQLDTFYGGVCVEFVNNDIFNQDYCLDEDFIQIMERIGSNDKISAMLSFRTEDGDPGAAVPRDSYEKFRQMHNETTFNETFKPIKRNPSVDYCGKGDNSVWEGNIYYSIKGGLQTSIESHNDLPDQLLFNPATDYANEQVCLDIEITMSFFALHCYDINQTDKDVMFLKDVSKAYLELRNYDEGNLYAYCMDHPSLKYGNGKLIDAIQLTPISIFNFKDQGVEVEKRSVVSHDEAANQDKFYFDTIQNCILSPARPINLSWSTHLSNMMQQNFALDEYILEEKKRYLLRKKLTNRK